MKNAKNLPYQITKQCAGQTYEDSIQELNNLIGELDSFQREHELKMKQKQREKQQQKHQQPKSLANGHDAHNSTGDTTMTASSIGDMSDIYNSLDKLSISSCDPNPLMCSTITHSSDIGTYGSDIGDGLNDLTDCQATTMSLKLNLSTTEHPLMINRHNHHSSTNSMNAATNGASMASQSSSNASNGSPVIRNIELIPDSYNVSDDYVKEHTEIVVLRRKNSQTDLNGGQEHIQTVNHVQNVVNGNANPNANANSSGKEVERISSFRCSSFAKNDASHSTSTNDGNSTLKRGQSMSSADSMAMAHRYNGNEYISGMPAMMQYDQDVVDHNDSDSTTAHMIRQKPIIAQRPNITQRPASLSGLFFF